jgi:hypothetical protein
MAIRSFEWTFTKRPLRRYELRDGQDTPVERRLSIPNIFLDAVDLFCNLRGIGWSWSTDTFRGGSRTPSHSIASVAARLFLKLTAYDASQYIMQLICPSTDNPGGGSIFDPTLPFLTRTFIAALVAIFAALWLYAVEDSMYHIATLIGRVLLRQSASLWPPLSRRPWMSTSIREFWGVRWHQIFRHIFVMYGARPGGALLGRPGAIAGAFALSAFIHVVGQWAFGRGVEARTDGGFFLLMGLGIILEGGFERATGSRVRGVLGWLWTMSWTLAWGTPMIDTWARRGVFASYAFPDRLRLGKILVNGAISLSGR